MLKMPNQPYSAVQYVLANIYGQISPKNIHNIAYKFVAQFFWAIEKKISLLLVTED